MNEPLPAKNALLQACRGDVVKDHPVLLWASELTNLHERKRARRHGEHDDIDRSRAELIREIDRWIIAQLPPSHGSAMVHTETVGAIIDRLAHLTSSAYAALTSVGEWDLWDVWEQLAELAVGYEDLATDVSTGRRRLPGGR